MKILILITAFFVIKISSFSQTNFDRGFNQGYKKGYCLNAGINCLAPLPPLSPLPQIGENLNSYQDGYNRGFEMGLSASSKSISERQRYKTSSAEPIEYIQKQNLNDIALAKVLKAAKGKAFELQEAGDYQASINIAEAGLKVIPKDDDFLMICASGYLNLENYSMGSAYLKKVAKFSNNPNTIKTSNEIIKEIETGEYQKQREQEKKEEPKPEIKTNSLSNEIKQAYIAKDYKKALELSNELISTNNSWQSYALRASIHFQLKNYSESIADYSKSLSLNPRPNEYFRRILAKEKLEDYYGVLNDYDKIIETGQAPDNMDMGTIYNNKAYTLVKLKRYDEALPIVNKALQLNSKEWYIWDTRGEINYQLGKYKECIEDMTRAIAIKANNNSYYFRGLAKIKMTDKVKGCEDLSKSGELGNSNAYTEIKKYCQ